MEQRDDDKREIWHIGNRPAENSGSKADSGSGDHVM